MSHYSLDELFDLWRRERLTVEQMIGQLLQTLQGHHQRLRELERRLPPAAGDASRPAPPDAGDASRPAPPDADRRK